MQDKKERKSPGPMDAELKAIQRCLKSMEDLSTGSKMNVCRYLVGRVEAEASRDISGAAFGENGGALASPQKQDNLFT